MGKSTSIKPTHKAIKTYYQKLQTYRDERVDTEPEIEGFQQAVDEFKTRVPELAKGLVEKIVEAHKTNKKFQAAFDAFFTLCRQTLNPNIAAAAVDEMLVQHLLTERLIRKIFDNPEFTRRNVIAAEVEKVIDALVSLSFNRDSFLRSLDRFYRAIEDAAVEAARFHRKGRAKRTVLDTCPGFLFLVLSRFGLAEYMKCRQWRRGESGCAIRLLIAMAE
jgi:predicted helicase